MDEAVKHIRNNEKWRREYMRFAEIEKERFDEGVEVGEARGANALIKLCEELGMEEKDIIKQLMEKLEITEDEAMKYMAESK